MKKISVSSDKNVPLTEGTFLGGVKASRLKKNCFRVHFAVFAYEALFFVCLCHFAKPLSICCCIVIRQLLDFREKTGQLFNNWAKIYASKDIIARKI